MTQTEFRSLTFPNVILVVAPDTKLRTYYLNEGNDSQHFLPSLLVCRYLLQMAVAVVIVFAFLLSIVSSEIMPDLTGDELKLAETILKDAEFAFTLSE